MEKVVLLSLSSDLKRIVQSIQREAGGSTARFNQEAKKWLSEAKKIKNPAIVKLIGKVEKVLKKKDNLKKAEECLMYSVLLQNRAALFK